MIDLDFRTIRNHDGSQDNGFEELVCQLAHLEKPSYADYFVRKDGGGGDAGVECFWKLLDDSEHGVTLPNLRHLINRIKLPD